MTTVAKRRRALLGRVMGSLLGLAVVVAGGVALASPPPSAAFADDDGRTWLGRTDGERTQLLLVNGISGSIEAESSVTGAGALTFAGRTGDSTVFRAERGLVVVGNGDHDAVHLPEVPDRVALGRDRALGLADDGVTWIELGTGAGDDRGRTTPIPGTPAPAPEAEPVLDADGTAWYLATAGGATRLAVAVAPDGSWRRRAVEDGADRLVVLDGVAHVVGPSGVQRAGADAGAAIEAGDIVPTVNRGTGGRWATASGTTVGGGAGVASQDLGSRVTALARWHGRLVAVTEAGAFTGELGALTPIDEIGGGARLHADGGLLWVTTAETAVAIDAGHDRVVLRLADADLSLCVGDCSAAAASQFLEQSATTTTTPRGDPSASPTTTQPPKKLDADVPPPTLAIASTTIRPATTTTLVSSTTAAVEAPPETTLPADAPPPPTTAPPAPGRSEDKGPKRDDPPPLLPVPPLAPSTTTTTTTAPEPEPEREPEPAVGLELEVVPGRASAEVVLRVLGSAEDCGAEAGATTATLAWEGGGSGSREVLVTWDGGAKRSETAAATIVAPAGELTVTATVCGVAASRTVDVEPVLDPTTTTTTTTTTPPSTTTTAPGGSTTTTTSPGSTTPTTPTTRPPTTTLPPATTTTTTKPSTTTSSTPPAAP